MADEPDDDVDTLLAGLAEKQRDYQRLIARVIPTGVAALASLGVINLTFVLVNAHRDPWLWRNVVGVVGLTGLGLMAWWGNWLLYRHLVMCDADLLDVMRNQGKMAEAINDMRPLMAAIEDARERGVPLLITPENMPPAPTGRTVH